LLDLDLMVANGSETFCRQANSRSDKLLTGWFTDIHRKMWWIWEKLWYRYCSKNVSGYRRHPRFVVAYSP